MKKCARMVCFAAVLIAVIMIAGCDFDYSAKLKVDGNVRIERLVPGHNPVLQIKCDQASLNYEERTLKIDGLITIGAEHNPGWVVRDMQITDGTLVIKLDSDALYDIGMNGQKHRLYEVKISAK